MILLRQDFFVPASVLSEAEVSWNHRSELVLFLFLFNKKKEEELILSSANQWGALSKVEM